MKYFGMRESLNSCDINGSSLYMFKRLYCFKAGTKMHQRLHQGNEEEKIRGFGISGETPMVRTVFRTNKEYTFRNGTSSLLTPKTTSTYVVFIHSI